MTYQTEFGDYDEMYGSLDYDDAVVLDIGADYGTTAKYFLERGAKSVHVSENNPEFVERMIEWVDGPDKPPVEILLSTNENLLSEWLTRIRPDVVKMDCEGCEKYLLDVNPDHIGIPDQWVIETHTRMLWDELRERFRLLGFTLTTIHEPTPLRTNPDKVVGIFQAVRDE